MYFRAVVASGMSGGGGSCDLGEVRVSYKEALSDMKALSERHYSDQVALVEAVLDSHPDARALRKSKKLVS